MKKLGVVALLVVALAMGMSASAASADQREVFKANLTAAPGVDTTAEGRATFKVGKDESTLDCLLTVVGVVNATGVYIRIVDAEDETTGSVTLVEVPDGTGPRPFSGLAVQKTIEVTDEVLTAMRAGRAYIDVRTNGEESPTLSGRIESIGQVE